MPRANFPIFPAEPGIFAIVLEKCRFETKTASRIKPLHVNSRHRLNGKLFGPKRETNPPNREIPPRAVAVHKKRNRKRHILLVR
jgi:hypothetical protein